MEAARPSLIVKLAETDEERRAAQRLRYRVFVEEMGATPAPGDAALRLERDRFDPYFDHILLIDEALEPPDPLDRVVGVYRVMRGAAARAGVGFYGASEYDLTRLEQSGRSLLELGRSCVDLRYRNGIALHLLWTGLGQYVIAHDIEVLFGVASFHGTDVTRFAQPLSYLHHTHLAPEDMRVRAQEAHFTPMDQLAADQVDRVRALKEMPSLIKAYLRLGGHVGEGAFVDHGFNTVDVCLLMDTRRMHSKYREMYTRGAQMAGL